MTTSMLAFGKANAFGSRKGLKSAAALYSTASTNASHSNDGPSSRPFTSADQRGLVVDVLTANATRRDAKQYINTFNPSKRADPTINKLYKAQEERNARYRKDQDRLDRIGVNLGALYTPARAIADSPQFTQKVRTDGATFQAQQDMHVALVCLRSPETLGDGTLEGVALTLSQLVKLGMRIVLVLDCGVSPLDGPRDYAMINNHRAVFFEQGQRICSALRRTGSEDGRIVSGALETRSTGDAEDIRGNVNATVGVPKLLNDPLHRGVIPIVPCFGYTPSGKLLPCSTSTVMSAITAELAGTSDKDLAKREGRPSLDRIIVLDDLGGIPSKARGDGAHVFINLEQEYDAIDAELKDYGEEPTEDPRKEPLQRIYGQHRANLSIARDCLAMLPSASSALIVSPREAASSSQMSSDVPATGAGTRRQKNTLIHNLLTNRPMISSSLPVARLPPTTLGTSDTSSPSLLTATLVKRGMPITIIPGVPRGKPWHRPDSGTTPLSPDNDPRVDLPRLVQLIESSFRRKLDVTHYLNRIQNRIAGLIIAGEYEGGAILTWEAPTKDSTPERLVPYLDKFAVLPSSQGSAGVADIVFQAMVRVCFPHGVCWRSRRDNPVNKWYFERSAGTWDIPESQWTMFWTGDGVVEHKQRWEDYVQVCRSVQPSWADHKAPD